MNRYIFFSGGVCSSLGKGLAATSLANLLESHGLRVQMIKIDPYLNVDAGTMSPYQHGEVYVTSDGFETDLDLGNYARFTNVNVTRANSITTGQVYQEVIKKEREGRYLGRTVQIIPHITDEIRQRIFAVGKKPDVDVTIIEIGGTVGDIESVPYLEAARQMIIDLGRQQVMLVHLTLIPEVGGGEYKTKPTQHSVMKLREIGIQPDVLICRSSAMLTADLVNKIALFTNVERDSVISGYDLKDTIYELPLVFRDQNLDAIVLKKLGLPFSEPDLSEWEAVVDICKNSTRHVNIGIVGKYLHQPDTYKSVFEALQHGGIANKAKVHLHPIDSEELEDLDEAGMKQLFSQVDGILIPGGFGSRGTLGMIRGAFHARTGGIPCFGICLGMQIFVIEYARNVLGWKNADSTEFRPETAHPVISLLEEQVNETHMGGTMRLGASVSILTEGTRIAEVYNSKEITERHRHRYEFASQYRDDFTRNGMILSGFTTENSLVESVEWPDHPWGIGVQFHPEFTSTPRKPNPLFTSFISASLAYQGEKKHEAD